MYQNLYPRPKQGGRILAIVVWAIAILLGIWLMWYGFTWIEEDVQPRDTPSPEAGSDLPTLAVALSTATSSLPTSLPMATSLPTATPLPPTPLPPSATSVVAYIVAGDAGVNVRAGPSTNYANLGYLEPGDRADLTGRDSNWWQIQYNGASAWVSGDWVTAFNADGVSQAQPPPQPAAPRATAIPPAAAATAAPTAAPTAAVPAANFRGLVPDKFEVEGAPGPYAVGDPIWFHMWITNQNNAPVEYNALGVWVQETGAVQKSWTYSQLPASHQFYHKDQMHDKIDTPGTYNLWLVIEFTDGESVLLKGPVVVTVQ